ncbi:DUF1287 domain-containing protein [Phaeodactylibacter luteus]|uniref:DUF1287 domain-containing protein n=2 Tax=Phaeodactylibacter luteus TaxID=1564516 RepID=A0A5C6S253_9BACT|nr:DUF1287 domain-containing protein [Phaeodactylibacter luteus]
MPQAFLFLLLSSVFPGRHQTAPPTAVSFFDELADAALGLTAQQVQYDPAYFSIDYPMGDVPAHKGVCTDVVVRAYRKVGIDLQQLVHEDMRRNFSQYPQKWGLNRPDPNIDHRRVPNLMTYFKRQGASLSTSQSAADYQPGDVVCWQLSGGLTHIGIVGPNVSHAGRPLIIHNIGGGQNEDDVLFEFPIIGHYRFGG